MYQYEMGNLRIDFAVSRDMFRMACLVQLSRLFVRRLYRVETAAD